jgi:hypothetical protein
MGLRRRGIVEVPVLRTGELPLVAGKRRATREEMRYGEYRPLAEAWRERFVEAARDGRRHGMTLAAAERPARRVVGPAPSRYR